MNSLRSTPTVVKAESLALSLLFYKGRFQVPWHQRYYDWKREHVSELLMDLEEAFREQRSCYFLGAVMLVKRSDSLWEVNDGQQRMVTYSLICAKLARTFGDCGDSLREALALRVLFDLNVNHTESLAAGDSLVPRLTPPRNDKTRFYQLIRGKEISPNGNLTDAWGEISTYLASMDTGRAKDFFDFVLNKLEVACLYVPRELDPSSVFETLNARGKPLSQLDLIRNHFYSFFSEQDAGPRRETVHDSLESVRSQLSADSKSAEYFRCFLQCKYGFLRKDRFYREMKARIKADCGSKSAQGLSSYVFDLVESLSGKDRVELFRIISAPSEYDSLIENFSKDSRRNRSSRQGKRRSPRDLFALLCDLKRYTVTQPIIFALLVKYILETDGRKKPSIARHIHERLHVLTSFVMRTAFVAKKFESSHFESAFSALAKQIMDIGPLDSVPFCSVLEESDEQSILDDSVFIERMKHTVTRQPAYAKRLLLGLAYHQQPDSVVINERRYTVEHILPKSDRYLSGWSNFDLSDHEDYVDRIGNLTLLANAENSPRAKDNRSFSQKRQIYQSSAIGLTREIASVSDWSPSAIVERQEQLAYNAAEVWSLL